jgi:hypothetical protein
MAIRKRARAQVKPRKRTPSVAVLRNSNLRKFLVIRYGNVEWPDDDAGRGDLWLAVHSLTTVGKDDFACRAFIQSKAPWLSESDTVAMLNRAYALPRPYSATKLGQELGLTDAQRTELQLWHIESIDVSKAVLIARKKRRKARRRTQRRRELGAVPHEISARRNRPWLNHGMSERVYYRWIEKLEKAIAAQGKLACNKSGSKMTPRKLTYLSGGQNAARNVTDRVTMAREDKMATAPPDKKLAA